MQPSTREAAQDARADTLSSALALRAREMPDKIWLRFIDGESFTYGEFYGLVETVARNLADGGLSKGDRIATFIGNSPEVVLVFFAAHLMGAIAVPLNNALRGGVLKHMLDLAEPIIVVATPNGIETVHEAIGEADYLQKAFLVGGGAPDDPRRSVQHAPFEALLQTPTAGGSPRQHVAKIDPCCIMYTSGTTGPSKGATYCNSFHVFMSDTCRTSMGYTAADVLYTSLPLFHGNAINTTLVPALLAGAEVVVAERFSVSRFWQHIRDSGATATNLLGAMSPMLLRQTPSPIERDHSLRTGLVIPSPPEYHDIFPRRFGFRPVEAYGLSDGGMILWAQADAPPGSCGRPIPGYECRIVDDMDHDVTDGETGELVFRPRRPWIVPLGYWRMPEATVQMWRNLWLHTGDLVRRDRDGWYFFVERFKDAIRRRGENISSFEVEAAVQMHPDVSGCAAYAVPSDLMEDEVAVAVALTSGAEVTEEALIRFVEDKLPYFAVPRYVRLVDTLPMTQTQKIQKQVLRDAGVNGCWDREKAGIEIRR